MMVNTAGTSGERLDGLALLGTHEPGRARDARVRARCHAALEKRRRGTGASARASLRRALEPAIAGALGAVYLLEVLSRAISLYRF
jgi:hypothetical protein